MSLKHSVVCDLLGVERGKFRVIRGFDPREEPVGKYRKYSVREAFFLKVLMELVNNSVPSLKHMNNVEMKDLFIGITKRNKAELDRSRVLWNKREDYIKIVDISYEYDEEDYRISTLPLKMLFNDFLNDLIEHQDSKSSKSKSQKRPSKASLRAV